ncbi:hypothetical protein ACIBP6_09890 [Nonomuraea terrae]|uniref:hypothetical protein n=1 Tax=Nonomuraea terrae TaxID=2530383 RepID=UPI0037BCADAA
MRINPASLAGGLLATTALLFALAPAASATANHDPRDGRHWGHFGHHHVHPHWGHSRHHHVHPSWRHHGSRHDHYGSRHNWGHHRGW